MTEYGIVLCTTDTNGSAKKIAVNLVEHRFAACVNIIPQVKSVYSWQGEIKQDEEFLLIIKTKISRYSELEEQIKKLHPYDIPEIIMLDINQGSKDYLKWIGENT